MRQDNQTQAGSILLLVLVLVGIMSHTCIDILHATINQAKRTEMLKIKLQQFFPGSL